MSSVKRGGLRQVLYELYKIRREGPVDSQAGICDNLEFLLIDEDGYETVGYFEWLRFRDRAFRAWDKYSGTVGFPVYDPADPRSPTTQYTENYQTRTLWEGVQGELRRDLLDHLIKFFTARLEETYE